MGVMILKLNQEPLLSTNLRHRLSIVYKNKNKLLELVKLFMRFSTSNQCIAVTLCKKI